MKKFIWVLFPLFLLAACDTQVSKVAITNIQHNVNDPQDGFGMVITVNYQIVGNLESEHVCAIGFADADGNGLVDKNNKYNTPNGLVCTSTEFTPSGNSGSIDLFIPYKELHLPDKRPVEIYAAAVIGIPNFTTLEDAVESEQPFHIVIE